MEQLLLLCFRGRYFDNLSSALIAASQIAYEAGSGMTVLGGTVQKN